MDKLFSAQKNRLRQQLFDFWLQLYKTFIKNPIFPQQNSVTNWNFFENVFLFPHAQDYFVHLQDGLFLN